MKSLHVCLCILVALTIFCSCTESQQNKPAQPEETSLERQKVNKDYTERMLNGFKKRNVLLSEEQIAMIRKIGTEFDFYDIDKEELIKRKREFRTRIFDEVLTPEQLKAVEKKN